VHGGGSALDQGVYPLTLADLLFGEYETLAATGSRLGPDGAPGVVDSELAMLLGYADGRQAMLATSLRSLLACDASISGSTGRIRILPAFWAAEAFVIERPLGGIDFDVEEVRLPKVGNGYVPMLEAVADALRDGRLEHELSSHAATLRVMRAVDAVLAQV
jgi:predicted dehydrogenase